MTYVEAYNALGFDTGILGEDRANAAGKRVMQKAREHKLFTVDEGSYDGSVPIEDMGEMNPDEERAYLRARTHYLEEMVQAQKKCNPYWRTCIHPRRAGSKRKPL